MAIALDSASGAVSNQITSGNFQTVNHTCTGSDLILFIAIETRDISGSTDIVSGVTYNGVAMTRINPSAADGGSTHRIYLYYLLNPSTGAHTALITVNADGTVNASGVSYTGVRQSSQPDASTTNTANNTSITTALTTVADNCWMISAISSNDTSPAAGTGITSRGTVNQYRVGDSNGVITPPASNSMQWTSGSSGQKVVVQASFAPSSVPSGGGFFQLL